MSPVPDQNAQPTRHTPTEPADTPASIEPAAARRIARLAGKKGGSQPRHVALIGLGDALPTTALRTHDDRMALLEAVVAAVAGGKTSGLVAQTLLAAVREARAEVNDALERLVQVQARKIAELESGRMVDAE